MSLSSAPIFVARGLTKVYGLDALVAGGLASGDVVVVYPSDTMSSGAKVAVVGTARH